MYTIIVTNRKMPRSFSRSLTMHRQGLLKHTKHKYTYLVPSVQHSSKDGFFTYLMLQLCSSRWFIPKILMWVSAPQHSCLCHGRNVLLSQPSLCQPLTIQPYCSKSTQEYLAVHGWRKYQHNLLWKKTSPFSPRMVSTFHSNCSAYLRFPHETVVLSKLYPIRQNICTSNHRVQYSAFKSSAYFKEFRYPKTVNGTLFLWFFKYISQTSNNKQVKSSVTNPGKRSDLDKEIQEISCCIRRVEIFLYYGKLLYSMCHLQQVPKWRII